MFNPLAKQLADAQAQQASALGPEPDAIPYAMMPQTLPQSTPSSLPAVLVPNKGPDEGQQMINSDMARHHEIRRAQMRPYGSEAQGPSAEFPEGLAANHPGKMGHVLHALSVAGNIAGNIVAPAAMAMAPGTQLNRQVQEEGLAHRLNDEIGDESANQQKQAMTARTTEETAEMPAKAADEASLLHAQTAKDQQTLEMGPSLAASYAHRVNQILQEGGNPAEDATVQHLQEAMEQNKPTASKAFQHISGTNAKGEQTYANYDPNKGEYTDLSGKVLTDFKPASKAMQGAYGGFGPAMLASRLLNAAYRNDPELLPHIAPMLSKMLSAGGGGDTADLQESLSHIPESLPQDSQGRPIGLAMPEAPTGATRSRGQFAESILPSISDAETQINTLGDKLGPMSGRFNELYAGKIGAYGPEFSGLQQSLKNIATAWMRLHANSDSARVEFTEALRGAKDPANLIANLNAIDAQAKDYVKQGKGRGGQGGNQPAQGGGNAIPAGGIAGRDKSGNIVGYQLNGAWHGLTQ